MPSASVLLLTGPPGAGKSTVAGLVAESFPQAVHLESDWFWTTIVSGHVAPWLPEADAQNRAVLGAAAAAAGHLAAGGYTLVMDGILGPWYLDLLIDALGQTGADVHYVVLRPRLDVLLERATTRAPRTLGIAPLAEEGPIRQLWEQFQNLGPLESHVIDTSDQDPEETAATVRTRFASGVDRL